MNLALRQKPQMGFTLVELLVALGIFLVITGAAFALLGSSQQRYQTESQVLNSFQEARLGLDQMVRDINDAGFPPPTFFFLFLSPAVHQFSLRLESWVHGPQCLPTRHGWRRNVRYSRRFRYHYRDGSQPAGSCLHP